MKIIGPASIKYYNKIKIGSDDFRNIIIFGDAHFDLTYDLKCCKNYSQIDNSLISFSNIITEIYISIIMIEETKKCIDILDNETESDSIYKKLTEIKNYMIKHKFIELKEDNLDFGKELINILMNNLNHKFTNEKKKKIYIQLDKILLKYNKKFNSQLLQLYKNLTKNKNKCFLIYQYLFNLFNQNNCIDFYYESNIKFNFKYNIGKNRTDFIFKIFYLFHLIKYISKNNFQDNLESVKKFIINTRLHESDIRTFHEAYKFNQLFYDFTSYYKNNLNHSQSIENIFELFLIDYINWIKDFIDSKNKKINFISKNNIYNDFFESIGIELREIVINQLEQIYKQYNKSIFADDNLNTVFNFIIYVFKNILNLRINLNNNINLYNDIYMELNIITMDIYTIFKLFIKKDKWDISKHPPNNTCSKYSYPKNIVCYYGFVHSRFYSEFISYYFYLDEKKRRLQIDISDINKNDFLKPTFSDINIDIDIGIQTDTANNKNIRCISIDDKLIQFDK